ncbi:hypothetical protein A5792_18550 [Mycolicibacterium peregrinum]|uniref:Ferredoxin n=1 Tax=Mycolicibacterium peregrinum TaxID=43304 RepID=A0A1A0R8F5_MYCPR|nr:hypothetical protein [Mycolicibacterium peregrinum]OBB30746.1 hypothetical protein A5792_18550 [Mycolicibacterium peregrinum]
MTYVIGKPCVDVMDRACVEECPVETYKDDNDAFFSETLWGRDGPLGSPGGAAKLGLVAADGPLVASLPPQQS